MSTSATTPARGLVNRWLYVLALPAILLNYTFVALAAVVLGDPPRTSLLAISLNFLFVFPLALISFGLLVGVRTQTAAAKLPSSIVGGMVAALTTLVLATLTYVPVGADVHGDVSESSSVASRLLNIDVDASAALANILLWGFVAVLLYLIPVCIITLRSKRQRVLPE